MGVMVEYVDLGAKRHGEYAHPGLIRLNERNRQDQMLSALAHETGHAIYCETGLTAKCLRADEVGAAMIITEGDYAEAEMLVGAHPGAIARHLGVTRRLVLGWQRWYARKRPPAEVEADLTD